MVRTGTRRTGGDRDGHAVCSRGRSVLSRQLLHPLAGVVLNAHAHQLADLMRPFVGKGVAGEVALPLSGHESSVQQHAPDAWKRYPVCKSCPLMGLGAPVASPSEPCHEHAWLRTPVQRRAQACAQRWRCVRERDPIRQPEPPLYFATMKRVNRDGIAVTGGAPKPPRLNAAEFSRVPTARLSRFSMRETIGKFSTRRTSPGPFTRRCGRRFLGCRRLLSH